MEIVYGVELTGMPLPDYLRMLRDNGLDTLPGTAAEILDDDVRFVLSRNKLSTEQWKAGDSHRPPMRHSQHIHADVRARRNTDPLGQSTCCCSVTFRSRPEASPSSCPLGFVHQNTLLFQQGIARPGPTLAEHLKIHALARVMLAGAINNIQVSWVKLNRRLSQLCLHAGANDYGGTLDGRKHLARSRSHGRTVHQRAKNSSR